VVTNLNEALKELEEALDPEALASDLLTLTGVQALEYDQSHPHEGWQDRTGELHDNFRYEVQGTTLIGENTAPHAENVEAHDGVSVLRSFDSGKVTDMLHSSWKELDSDRVL